MNFRVERSKLLSVFIFINFAQGGTWPLIPLMILHIGGTVADIGLAAFAYYAATMFSSKLWGKVSDLFGKRRIFIILSFAASSVLYLIFSFATNVYQIIVLSFILGFLITAYAPSAIMLIIEHSRKNEWASRISSYNLYSSLGWSLGLLIGSMWMIGFSLSSFFILCSLAASLSLIAALLFVRDPKITLERDHLPILNVSVIERKPFKLINLPEVLNIKRLIKNIKGKYIHNLSIYYSSLLIFFMAFNTFFTPLAAYFKELLIEDSIIFILLAIHQLSATISFVRVGSLIANVGETKVIVSGILVRIFVFTVFLLVSVMLSYIQFNMLIFIPLLFLTGISWALFWNSNMSLLSKRVNSAHLGEAQGNLNSIVGLGTILGALLSGYIVSLFGFTGNFFITSLIMVIGLIIFRMSKI